MRRALSNSITKICHLVGLPSPSRLLARHRYDAFLIGYPKVGWLSKSENTKEPERSRKVREGKVGGHKAHLLPETIAHINARVQSELPTFYGYPNGKTDS